MIRLDGKETRQKLGSSRGEIINLRNGEEIDGTEYLESKKESRWNRTFEHGIAPRQESEQHGAAFEQTLERLQAKKSTLRLDRLSFEFLDLWKKNPSCLKKKLRLSTHITHITYPPRKFSSLPPGRSSSCRSATAGAATETTEAGAAMGDLYQVTQLVVVVEPWPWTISGSLHMFELC